MAFNVGIHALWLVIRDGFYSLPGAVLCTPPYVLQDSTGCPVDLTSVQFRSHHVLYMSSQWPGNVQYPTGHPLDIDQIPTGHLGIIKFTLSEVQCKGEHLADTCT
jgi:hypothetical protein